ncbi:MAG: membrane protein insertion efficiency factor YidD [Ignavibacteriaceae bacterium]
MIINKKYLFLVLFFLQFTIFSQTDWIRWEKSDPSYQVPEPYLERQYDLKIESASDLLLKPLLNSYWFFISDVDGANCPFYPSCSRFFLESVKQTNFVQGTLMFFDRFTRDTNIVDRQKHYAFYDSQHLYDPVTSYTLKKGDIKIIPPNIYVKE